MLLEGNRGGGEGGAPGGRRQGGGEAIGEAAGAGVRCSRRVRRGVGDGVVPGGSVRRLVQSCGLGEAVVVARSRGLPGVGRNWNLSQSKSSHILHTRGHLWQVPDSLRMNLS